MTASGKPQTQRAATLTRLVLACDAVVISVTVPLLLLAPQLIADWLGLTSVVADTRWVLQIVGAGAIALAGHMWLIRRSADATVLNAAAIMLINHGVMTLLVAVMSGEWTTVRWIYLLVSAFFVLVYAAPLLWAQRGASSAPPSSQ
jgi:hypothetical protein